MYLKGFELLYAGESKSIGVKKELLKPIYTQNGAYRANFMGDVNKSQLKIMKKCCNGDSFNDQFCNFSKDFTKIRRKDLPKLIALFLEHQAEIIEDARDSFMDGEETITPAEFFEIRATTKGDFVGVYIIYNETKDMYYVGQAKRLLFRINQHFTGHGNGDVYADYKYGDSFVIQIIKLSESGYDDLDELERDMIDMYDASVSGYNKTVGNN